MIVKTILIVIGFIQINNNVVDCKLNELFHWKQLTFNGIDGNNNINNININNNNDQNVNYTKYQNDEIIFMDDDNFSSKLNHGRALNVQNRPINNIKPSAPTDTNTNNNNYIPYNNIPMGVSHYKDKLFITIPRRRPGVPSTLNYISLKSSNMERSPSLTAYPNNNMNALNPQMQPDISKIISVYRTRIDDKCNRLWFIDTGRLEYPGNPIQVQRPSIWIINLENNKPIRRYEIPRNIVEAGQGMASITIDVDDTSSSSASDCDNAHAYIPDLLHNRLYVYSLNANRMWSFNHNAFSFDPIYGDFNVANLEYQWNDGIFSITLGNRNDDGFKTAYFHAMISISEFMVSTEVLKNETLSSRSYHGNDFKLLGMRGQNTQSAMHDFDENSGIIFYSQIGLNGISCWNTANEFSPNNHILIAQDNETMIYPSDVNVDSDGILWVMTNSLPLFLYSTLDTDEYNFRIWKQSVSEAISGTDCKR